MTFLMRFNLGFNVSRSYPIPPFPFPLFPLS